MSRQTGGLVLWMMQRISAIYLAVFIVYLLIHLYLHPAVDHQAWREWVARPLVSVAFAGFVLAVLVHCWVGMRNVVLDYIRPLGLRLIMLALIALILIGCGFWAVRVLIVASL